MASLQLLLCRWRDQAIPPDTKITAQLVDNDQQQLYVGFDTGTILRYSLPDLSLELAMVGHGSAVKALCLSRYKMDLPRDPVPCLVSIDAQG